MSYTYTLVGDFWSFDVDTAWWTTVHVSIAQNFGAQGVASISTFPGLKFGHACAMSHFDNGFNLFGGSEYSEFHR